MGVRARGESGDEWPRSPPTALDVNQLRQVLRWCYGGLMNVGWKASVKALGKGLAKGAAWALVRGVGIVSLFAVVNVGLAVALFVLTGRAGGGSDSLLLFLLAMVAFSPFVIVAFVLAQKQGVARVVSGAVQSQGPTLAAVGAHYLSAFARERYGKLSDSRAAAAFDRNWQRYVRGRREGSWALRLVLRQVTKRVPLGEMIAQLAERHTPAGEIPQIVMGEVLSDAALSRLGPSWLPILALLTVNVAWFPLALYLVKLLLGG